MSGVVDGEVCELWSYPLPCLSTYAPPTNEASLSHDTSVNQHWLAADGSITGGIVVWLPRHPKYSCHRSKFSEIRERGTTRTYAEPTRLP